MSQRVASASSGGSNADKAYQRLVIQFPGKVFEGKTGSFEFWDAKQTELMPKCRIEPESAEDVSSILKILVEENCPFAIKSGGNARGTGSSNIKGGVTIDMGRMKEVEISEDRQSVKISTGARWFDVYTRLDPEGLTVLGGRVGFVGVGGYLLGGGISFYSGRLGWACDGIVSFTLVLPNGDIINVNSKDNDDLFWALRGAGNSNFGIVTSFVLEALPLLNPKGIWTGAKMYTQDKIPQLLERMHDVWTTTIAEDLDLAVINFYIFSAETGGFVAITFRLHGSHDDPSSWPKSLVSFESIKCIPGSANSGILPLAAVTVQMGQGVPAGKRNYFLTFCYKPSLELETALYQIFEEEVVKLKAVEGFQSIMIIQPIARSTMSFMQKRGGNCLGLNEDDGPLILMGYNWIYLNGGDDKLVAEVAVGTLERAEAKAKELGGWHQWKYLNYGDEILQGNSIWEGYGKENFARLKAIQKKVDPSGVFTDGGLASGYFKLN